MGFKETRAYLEKCISRSALVCPFGFAAGRNKLCVCSTKHSKPTDILLIALTVLNGGLAVVAVKVP